MKIQTHFVFVRVHICSSIHRSEERQSRRYLSSRNPPAEISRDTPVIKSVLGRLARERCQRVCGFPTPGSFLLFARPIALSGSPPHPPPWGHVGVGPITTAPFPRPGTGLLSAWDTFLWPMRHVRTRAGGLSRDSFFWKINSQA